MLSPRAEQLIHDYLNLPFKGITGVRAPYFNNARGRERGQLRSLIGKGTPTEIAEEAQIISIQYHAGLFDKNGDCCLHEAHPGASADAIRKFLVDHDLGIECSGFVTQILRAHYAETKHFDLMKKMFIISPAHLIRWLITRLRPVENINVRSYTNDRNTSVVASATVGFDYSHVQPGDLITMLETGPNNKRNHIVLVTDVSGKTIRYVHARAWTSEGQYDHGVARGIITITKSGAPLTEQKWEEKDTTGEKNETLAEAKLARSLEIRRLHW